MPYSRRAVSLSSGVPLPKDWPRFSKSRKNCSIRPAGVKPTSSRPPGNRTIRPGLRDSALEGRSPGDWWAALSIKGPVRILDRNLHVEEVCARQAAHVAKTSAPAPTLRGASPEEWASFGSQQRPALVKRVFYCIGAFVAKRASRFDWEHFETECRLTAEAAHGGIWGPRQLRLPRMPTLLFDRCRWARFRHIVSQNIDARRDTLVADRDGRPSNELSNLIPGLTAKGAPEIVANSRLVVFHRRTWSLHSWQTRSGADGLTCTE